MTPPPSRSVKFAGTRKMIARKMMESLATTAQLSFTARVDATHLVETRAGWKDAGYRIGYEDLLLFALRDTLTEYPAFNAIAGNDTVDLYDEICVSVAIALGDTLVAPSLADIRGKTVQEIAGARRELVERARAGKLSVAEMSFGTFTISNLGMTRVESFTPILNGGQVAILGIGRIGQTLGLSTNGHPIARPEIALSLTSDHRVVDGAPSGAFLTALAERIETDLPLASSTH